MNEQPWKCGPRRETLTRIEALKTFLSPDRPISKRAAMYRLLSMGLLDSTKDFHNFNRALNRALESGEHTNENFDDDCFDDNRRRTDRPMQWANLEEFVNETVPWYRRDFWQDQPERVEVWLEKDTAAFLVKDTTNECGVPLRISSGHYSRTFLYKAAQSIAGTSVPLTVLYIGDFDPSGLDVERAARRGSNGRDGVADFLEKDFGWRPGRFEKQVKWLRLGVSLDDYKTMPVKARVSLKEDGNNGDKERGDPRAESFKDEYDDYGVEVEALEVLEAGGLARRVENEIRKHIDVDAWNKSKQQQKRDLKRLRASMK